jgi:hypothetical protein
VRPACCVPQVITPFNVYFNTHLIFKKGEVWRLLTNFFFFGNLGKHQHYSIVIATVQELAAASKASLPAVSLGVVISKNRLPNHFCCCNT